MIRRASALYTGLRNATTRMEVTTITPAK